MLSIVKSSYGLILFALLFSGVELFVWFYLGEVGLLASLIEQDQSRVSALIIAIYVLATLHFLFACYSTSQQFIDIGLSPAQDSRSQVLKQFFQRVDQIGKDQHKLQELIEVLDIRLRSTYAFGFILADLMLKLGILGTVIGFIIMLGSLTDLNSVDITVMQNLLAEMSGGMKVALFTTLTGILAGIILNVKYNLVDWAVDHLLNEIRESLACR
ncbi:MAG: MotA/TolQ/ExbB proton channel family protein [Gammaproteobacteria bacterium]|nr:MotA/TolQ/ExbB proton channel family protein [Gammaproteobacteria bacterium]